MKKQDYLRKVLALLPLCLLALMILPKLRGLSVSEILSYTPEEPFLAALVLLGLYALKSLTMVLPAAVLTLTSGVLFALPVALLLSFLGYLLELSLGYRMGDRLGRERVEKRLSKNGRVARFLAGRREHDASTCLLCRLVLPVEPCSLFFGALGMPFGRYLLFSMLGRLPSMLLFLFAGAFLDAAP